MLVYAVHPPPYYNILQALGILNTCVIPINSLRPSDLYMHRQPRPSLFQIMASRLFSAKPLSEPMLVYCWMDTLGTNFSEIWIEILTFSFKKMPLKISSAKWRPFCHTYTLHFTAVLIIRLVCISFHGLLGNVWYHATGSIQSGGHC